MTTKVSVGISTAPIHLTTTI